jgi:hypothetical protein
MINILHLIWIIPVCLLLGSVTAGFFMSVTKSNREYDIYEEGIQEGLRRGNINPQTLQRYIMKSYNGDINAFLKDIDGFIYGEEPSGQLILVHIDSGIELLKYKSCEIVCMSEVEGKRKPVIKV